MVVETLHAMALWRTRDRYQTQLRLIERGGTVYPMIADTLRTRIVELTELIDSLEDGGMDAQAPTPRMEEP